MMKEQVMRDDDMQSDHLLQQELIAEDEILQLSEGENVSECERIDDERTLQEFETMIHERDSLAMTDEQSRVEQEEQYCHLQELQREDNNINSINDNLSLYYSEREILEQAKKKLIDQDVCAICMNEIEINNLVVVDCGHHFCSTCINPWVQHHSSCPICRKDVSIFIKHRTIKVTFRNCSPNYNGLGYSFPDYWVEDFDLVYTRQFVLEMVSYYGRNHQEDEKEYDWYRGKPNYEYRKDLMFMYKGNMISINDTPMTLGMKDGDYITIKHKVLMLIRLPRSRFSSEYDYDERCYDCLPVEAFCKEYMKAWKEDGNDYYYTYGDIVLNSVIQGETMSMLLMGGGGTIRVFYKREVHERATTRQNSENISADHALIETLYEMKSESRRNI